MGIYRYRPVVIAAGGVGTADGKRNTAKQCVRGAIGAAFGIDHTQSVIPGGEVAECRGALPPGSAQAIGIRR